MENTLLLIIVGLIIGTVGTLIGAGGGFILVPFLLFFYPQFEPETITAISIAVVALNSISGSFAYARSGRIDYKAGVTFALYTIPGSILGVWTVKYINEKTFNIIFGILLVVLSIYLFFKNRKVVAQKITQITRKGYKSTKLTDKAGTTYEYSYKQSFGAIISVFVGYISPLLGIGGGIIHVPAMVNWLRFPVHIATATSHFILAVMATVSVITHAFSGTYSNNEIILTIVYLSLGVVPGAQLGAYFSHRIKSHVIIRALAVCLIIVGFRILFYKR
ncbi:sulfite exporter TauE/SafE family protein [Flavobacterium beibuense]|uniref:Probable membrane transporter protein n=1 Tax=Flavobacterium beibuense TaxID=657326 RepID=A0A444WGB4_9FLAO|nr:sulfite exporter TauE/SafE family protein [Flavobacterium beibuense]RYJ44898.1 putative permease [Flavobacterium beibuense]